MFSWAVKYFDSLNYTFLIMKKIIDSFTSLSNQILRQHKQTPIGSAYIFGDTLVREFVCDFLDLFVSEHVLSLLLQEVQALIQKRLENVG